MKGLRHRTAPYFAKHGWVKRNFLCQTKYVQHTVRARTQYAMAQKLIKTDDPLPSYEVTYPIPIMSLVFSVLILAYVLNEARLIGVHGSEYSEYSLRMVA